MSARHTFLRRHAAQQSDLRAGCPDWEGLEVFRSLPASAASLRDFFHGNDPLPPLYRPVPVEPHPGDARPGDVGRAAELPELLARLHGQRDRDGVLLFAPGGAGKSVALRKAFLDCLDPHSELGRTGLIPCWLRLPMAPAEMSLRELFRHAVEPEAPLADDAPVWGWLDSGPPVLLLCDLDDPRHVAPRCRATLAGFLGQLQASERFSRRGHRIVVAYRSSGELCQVAQRLLSPGRFRRHRLLELPVEAVRSYLIARRAWSQHLSGSTEGPLDLEPWQPFLERMERRPLLMHLLGAFFDGQTVQEAPTAARLVARLVEQQLTHALGAMPAGLLDSLSSQSQHNLRRWTLTGLARATRRAWALRQHACPHPRQHLQEVMLDPKRHLPAQPQSDYWLGGFTPYWRNESALDSCLMAVLDLVCGSPWLSLPDDEHYRVGPPVFVNFFAAAMPTRYPQGPPVSFGGQSAALADDDPWFDEVVALWRKHLDAWAGEPLHGHDAWQQGAALVAGLLSEGEYFALVRAWLRGGDHGLLRLGEAVLHGRHPAEPPSPPQCPPDLLSRLRDALAEASHTDFVSDPMSVCHELLADELRPALEAFAQSGGPS